MTASISSTTKLLTRTVPVPVAVSTKAYPKTKQMLAIPVVMGSWATGLCLQMEL